MAVTASIGAPGTAPNGAAIAASLDALIRQGDSAAAAAHARRTLQALPERERIPVLISLARAHQQLGQPHEALRAAGEARELARFHDQPRDEVEAALRTVSLLQSADNHAVAMTLLEDIEPLVEASEDPRLRSRVLRRLGVSASMLGKHDLALKHLDQALEIARVFASPRERLAVTGSVLTARSRRCSELPPGDPRRIADLAVLADSWRDLAAEQRELGLRRQEATSLGNCAICAWRSGRPEEALRDLRALLPRYVEFRLADAEMLANNDIGNILLELGRHDEAAAAFERTIERSGGGSPRVLREAWLGLVTAHEARDDPRAALAALKRARELDQRMTQAALSRWVDERELRRELSRLNEQGWRLAQEDALTGLPNRRALTKWLDETLPTASPAAPVSVLLIDADHFKRVNDAHGHATGDEVLRQIGEIVRSQCRFRDLPARLGGEEFLVALPGARLASAAEAARRLCNAIASFKWAGIAEGLQVTVSIGVASSEQYAAAPPTAEDLIALADSALYAAKNTGRNRVVIAPAPAA